MTTRPQAEKYGITDADWKTLEILSVQPEKAETELQEWLSRGYISEFQARDIWNELQRRQLKAYATALGKPVPAHKAVGIKPRYTTVAVPMYTPRPRYEPAIEEMRTELATEMPQAENWRDWFRSNYPSLIEQFEATRPELGRAWIYPKGIEIEREAEKSWAAHLKRQKPKFKERWYSLTPYQRGERPSYYAPRIQTVGF